MTSQQENLEELLELIKCKVWVLYNAVCMQRRHISCNVSVCNDVMKL